MRDLLAITLIVLSFLALVRLCVLVCAGWMFLRMAGSYASCEAVYRAWREQRDAATDELLRRGFKAARDRNYLPEKWL